MEEYFAESDTRGPAGHVSLIAFSLLSLLKTLYFEYYSLKIKEEYIHYHDSFSNIGWKTQNMQVW